MVLTTRDIPFVTIDISAPGMQEMRSFMRERGQKREGQRNVLPPQIFNGEEHRGDFEGFDIANEDDELEEFLGIPRKCPKVEPVKTGAVASDIGQLNPGKLNLKENLVDHSEHTKDNETKLEEKDVRADKEVIQELLENSEHKQFEDLGSEVKDEVNAEISVGNLSENDVNNLDNLLKETLSIGNESDSANCEDHDYEACEADEDTNEYTKKDKTIEDKAYNVLSNNKQIDDNQTEWILIDNDEDSETNVRIDNIGDSSDDSSDEDTAVEYMPDGEIVRKKSRGFKQLTNCKRFWKASLNVG